MEEYEEPASVNFIPCIKWIRKGVARQNPVKIELNRDELTAIVKSTNKLHLGVQDKESNSEDEDNATRNVSQLSVHDEFDLENYDNDDNDSKLNIGDIAVYDDDDPFNVNEEGPNSDDDDDLIKPEDNLIVVGHVEGYASSLEIYVHNDFENTLYVHHDILLPSIPLCLEWLNYDPADVNRAANLCAVGTMSPIIDVWDIDLVNCIEPLYKLGRKGSRKKGISKIGHKDAVLDLSWNTYMTHILASGSVDKTVLLWDLEVKEPHTTLTAFEEKIQSLKWHPVEAEMLLTGSCDRTCKVFNCQTTDSYKSWTLTGEVERVVWNHFNPYQFIASDSQGFLYLFDCRQDNPLWKVQAHSKEATGLSLSPQCPGFLATASQDGTCKAWDINDNGPELIAEKNLKIGEIQCLESAPDDPFLMASGGDNRSRNLFVFSAIQYQPVQLRFRDRTRVPSNQIEGTSSSYERPCVHPVMKKGKKVKENSLKVIKKKKEFRKMNKK